MVLAEACDDDVVTVAYYFLPSIARSVSGFDLGCSSSATMKVSLVSQIYGKDGEEV